MAQNRGSNDEMMWGQYVGVDMPEFRQLTISREKDVLFCMLPAKHISTPHIYALLLLSGLKEHYDFAVKIVFLDDAYKMMYQVSDVEISTNIRRIKGILNKLGLSDATTMQETYLLRKQDLGDKIRETLYSLMRGFTVKQLMGIWKEIGYEQGDIEAMKMSYFTLPFHMVSNIEGLKPKSALIGALDRPFMARIEKTTCVICMPKILGVNGHIVAMGDNRARDNYIILGEDKRTILEKLLGSFREKGPLITTRDIIHLSVAVLRIIAMADIILKDSIGPLIEEVLRGDDHQILIRWNDNKMVFKDYFELEHGLKMGSIPPRPFAEKFAEALLRLHEKLLPKRKTE